MFPDLFSLTSGTLKQLLIILQFYQKPKDSIAISFMTKAKILSFTVPPAKQAEVTVLFSVCVLC